MMINNFFSWGTDVLKFDDIQNIHAVLREMITFFSSDGYCSSPVNLTPCSHMDHLRISPQMCSEKGR